jgi:hypothetical protein
VPAFGKTKLQIINEVLPRMRERTVATSSSTTYAALVSSVLNTIKTQIEQAWQWRNLRDTFTVTVTPGTTSYALTSSGQFATIIDIWNTTTNRELERGTTRGFNEKFFGQSTVQTGDVSEYNVVGLDANYDVQIDTWPNVTRSNVLKANLYLPQQDPATDDTVILVPNQVLIEGIVAYLMAERGDDSGVTAQAQQDLYKEMLAGAIAAEIGQDQSEVDWTPV